MPARKKIIALSAALSFLATWNANPPTASAQVYCYQAPPVQVLTYPTYYGYISPTPVSYTVVYPESRPYKYKQKHKHKRKYKYKY